jgi:general secretion pathway protein K
MMKTMSKSCAREEGIALIIVMIVIVVLAVLAGGFAYSMKVETRLARNTSLDPDLETLARSGVEHARWELAEQLRDPDPKQRAYTGRQQKWAGGPANTNEPLVHVERRVEMAPGKVVSWEAFDMESKYNLSNIRDERFSPVLQRALEMIGADGVQVTDIVESYLDWVDPDDNKRTQGAETDFYLNLNPAAPYIAKNGLMDDVSELLLIRGMTPDIYFGAKRVGTMPRFGGPKKSMPLGQALTPTGGVDVGLMDLFTTISAAGMAVNVHTASAEVLQLLPGMDAALAQSIVETREIEPFMRPGELINVPGMTPELMGVIGRYFVLNSSIFQVIVEARIGTQARWYEALLHRRNAQDVMILYFRVL